MARDGRVGQLYVVAFRGRGLVHGGPRRLGLSIASCLNAGCAADAHSRAANLWKSPLTPASRCMEGSCCKLTEQFVLPRRNPSCICSRCTARAFRCPTCAVCSPSHRIPLRRRHRNRPSRLRRLRRTSLRRSRPCHSRRVRRSPTPSLRRHRWAILFRRPGSGRWRTGCAPDVMRGTTGNAAEARMRALPSQAVPRRAGCPAAASLVPPCSAIAESFLSVCFSSSSVSSSSGIASL